MRSQFHRTIAVFMALVVLMSTTSLAVNVHYCGHKLVDWGVFTHAKSCVMKAMETSSSTDCTFTKKSCCSDDQITIEGQDELKISKETLTLKEQFLVAAVVQSYIFLFEETPTTHLVDDGYPPPLPRRDFQVLFQQFLI